MRIVTVGIDLAKNVIAVHGVDDNGQATLVKPTVARDQLLAPTPLTALAAMLGALFILDDPIFNALAISLIFGIMVSTLLTLVVIPVLYFAAFKRRFA